MLQEISSLLVSLHAGADLSPGTLHPKSREKSKVYHLQFMIRHVFFSDLISLL